LADFDYPPVPLSFSSPFVFAHLLVFSLCRRAWSLSSLQDQPVAFSPFSERVTFDDSNRFFMFLARTPGISLMFPFFLRSRRSLATDWTDTWCEFGKSVGLPLLPFLPDRCRSLVLPYLNRAPHGLEIYSAMGFALRASELSACPPLSLLSSWFFFFATFEYCFFVFLYRNCAALFFPHTPPSEITAGLSIFWAFLYTHRLSPAKSATSFYGVLVAAMDSIWVFLHTAIRPSLEYDSLGGSTSFCVCTSLNFPGCFFAAGIHPLLNLQRPPSIDLSHSFSQLCLSLPTS